MSWSSSVSFPEKPRFMASQINQCGGNLENAIPKNGNHNSEGLPPWSLKMTLREETWSSPPFLNLLGKQKPLETDVIHSIEEEVQ